MYVRDGVIGARNPQLMNPSETSPRGSNVYLPERPSSTQIAIRAVPNEEVACIDRNFFSYVSRRARPRSSHARAEINRHRNARAHLRSRRRRRLRRRRLIANTRIGQMETRETERVFFWGIRSRAIQREDIVCSLTCFERVQRRIILVIKIHRCAGVRVTITCARANVHSFALKTYGFVTQELDK